MGLTVPGVRCGLGKKVGRILQVSIWISARAQAAPFSAGTHARHNEGPKFRACVSQDVRTETGLEGWPGID